MINYDQPIHKHFTYTVVYEQDAADEILLNAFLV